MIVQLHAQDPVNPAETEFLMQGEVSAEDDAEEWFAMCATKWEAMTGLRPEGWTPMICTEAYKGFLKAAGQVPENVVQ
jgi:hypothetical protein